MLQKCSKDLNSQITGHTISWPSLIHIWLKHESAQPNPNWPLDCVIKWIQWVNCLMFLFVESKDHCWLPSIKDKRIQADYVPYLKMSRTNCDTLFKFNYSLIVIKKSYKCAFSLSLSLTLTANKWRLNQVYSLTMVSTNLISALRSKTFIWI